MPTNNPTLVREQYASESRLRARQAIYGETEGEDPRQLAFEAVAEARPERVLAVGGGQGELAERIVAELGCELVMLDLSERMVELARERGVDARVGDVQQLPFPDASFDVCVAAWMLYHVPDVNRGVAELARVLRPGGRLVAVTNSQEHLKELRDLFPTTWESTFRSEDGEQLLSSHFPRVERRDAEGWVTIPSREAILAYLRTLSPAPAPADLDLPVEAPLRVRRSSTVFVAIR